MEFISIALNGQWKNIGTDVGLYIDELWTWPSLQKQKSGQIGCFNIEWLPWLQASTVAQTAP